MKSELYSLHSCILTLEKIVSNFESNQSTPASKIDVIYEHNVPKQILEPGVFIPSTQLKRKYWSFDGKSINIDLTKFRSKANAKSQNSSLINNFMSSLTDDSKPKIRSNTKKQSTSSNRRPLSLCISAPDQLTDSDDDTLSLNNLSAKFELKNLNDSKYYSTINLIKQNSNPQLVLSNTSLNQLSSNQRQTTPTKLTKSSSSGQYSDISFV